MLQRRSVVLGLAALPVLAATRPAFAQSATDTIPTSAGDVGIHPVKHASFALTSGAQTIYFDPADSDFSGLPAATAIVITHAHGDHFKPELLPALAGDTATLLVTEDVFGKLPETLKPRATVLRNGESGTIAGVPVDAVAAYNTTADRQQYHPKGVGNAYVLTFGDKKVLVAGDTEPTPELLALTGVEVAFLPMNLPYTMSVDQAAEMVKAFKPRIVYPYHFGDSDTAAFAAQVGDAAEVRLANWYPA